MVEAERERDGRLPVGREVSDKRAVVALAAVAISLRLLTFIGRGDFVAFDEGWYLLLGQSLWDGEGYRLTGLRHTTLSPLFPVLAGGLGELLGDLVWAGRIVAAVMSGLLVLPCWFIFRRLAGRRTAWLACIIIAALPSLSAFTVPYWVGWDLWMGPEPVFHFFLFTGFAFALRGHGRNSPRDWTLAGVAFALAYLARPEAVLIAGLLVVGAGSAAVVRTSIRSAVQPLLFAIAFGVCAAPYWVYLHDALGRWTLTGRHLPVAAVPRAESAQSVRGDGATERIERMLWQGDDEGYARILFSLDPSGTRMGSSYWGVWPETVEARATLSPIQTDRAALAGPGSAASIAYPQPGTVVSEPSVPPEAGDAASQGDASPSGDPAPARPWLYARALDVVVPVFVWPFIVVGLTTRRRRDPVAESVVVGPLIVSGILVAAWVAIDPRTQLMLAPLLAFYAARGIRILGIGFDRRRLLRGVRRGIVPAAIGCGVVGLLILADAHRLYSSVARGSPHHVLGAENRAVGEALRDIVPPGQPIMSWDPSVAIYAQRDWRVLPYASLPDILRYAMAIGCEYIVLSRYYPSPPIVREVPANHLVLRLPPSMGSAERWRIEVTSRDEHIVVGQVVFD